MFVAGTGGVSELKVGIRVCSEGGCARGCQPCFHQSHEGSVLGNEEVVNVGEFLHTECACGELRREGLGRQETV